GKEVFLPPGLLAVRDRCGPALAMGTAGVGGPVSPPAVGTSAGYGDRSLVAEHLRDEERQLQGLLGVHAWIDGRVVALRQVHVGDGLSATDDLGDVVARELYVHAARVGAECAVDLEEALDLVDDAVEVAGLVAIGAGVGVAVHRVGLPDDLVSGGFHGLHDRWQDVADLVVAHAGDQRQSTRIVVRVEAVDVLHGLLRGGRRPDLHADRVT